MGVPLRYRTLVAAATLALLPGLGLGGAAGAVSAVEVPSAPPAPDEVPQVLAPVDPASGTGPTAAGLSAALAELLRPAPLGGVRGIAVVDVPTGAVLYETDGMRPITPASTTKVLTAAGILTAMGPDAVLRTRVQRVDDPGPTVPPASPDPGAAGSVDSGPPPDDTTPGTVVPPPAQLVLVGGGDPLLSSLPKGSDKLPDYPRRASLVDLAVQTVRELTDDGITAVRLQYDGGIFPGPAASPHWVRTYTGDVVGPVMGLSADQGRNGPLNGGRVNDPALRTAQLFAAELERRGIDVLGSPAAGVAPAEAPTLAEVTSAPIAALVEYMLVESDNDVAEALLRQIAVARGKPGTFADGVAALLGELSALGVDVAGVTLHDGSGLSRDNRIPPQVIARTLALAAAGPRVELRPLIAGLAVAGTNGTLSQRFTSGAALPARGVLRGKSGYLTGVVSLSGVVLDASGRLLAFDVAADAVRPGAGLAVRSTWDRVAGVLAACGCS